MVWETEFWNKIQTLCMAYKSHYDLSPGRFSFLHCFVYTSWQIITSHAWYMLGSLAEHVLFLLPGLSSSVFSIYSIPIYPSSFNTRPPLKETFLSHYFTHPSHTPLSFRSILVTSLLEYLSLLYLLNYISSSSVNSMKMGFLFRSLTYMCGIQYLFNKYLVK